MSNEKEKDYLKRIFSILKNIDNVNSISSKFTEKLREKELN